MSLNKSFKEEVESHPWAVNHSIPKGFFHGLTAVSVSLFALYCALPNPSSLLPGVGESWDVKNMMIHSSVTSFSAVIFSSAKLKGESGVKAGIFWNRPFSSVLWDWLSQSTLLDRLQSVCWSLVYTVAAQPPVVWCVSYVSVCLSLWTNIQGHLYTHAPINVCMLAHVFLRMYVCVCVCVCVSRSEVTVFASG